MREALIELYEIAHIFAEKFKKIMKTIICSIGDNLWRILVTIAGAIWGYLLPTLPFAAICFFAIILDCITAFRLARRVHKKYPEKNVVAKFRSDKAYSIFPTILVVYSCIVLGYMIDKEIFPFLEMYLANAIAGGFCLWNLYSILENESSENDKSWAKFLQRFMVNKASRHIEDFKESWEQTMHESKERGHEKD